MDEVSCSGMVAISISMNQYRFNVLLKVLLLLSNALIVSSWNSPICTFRNPSRRPRRFDKSSHRYDCTTRVPKLDSIIDTATCCYMSLPDPIDTTTSGLVSICRFPRGTTILESKSVHDLPDNERPVIQVLYDVENNLECRKVREMITELDLVVENVVPASLNSKVFTDPSNRFALGSNSVGKDVPRMVFLDKSTDQQPNVLIGCDNILSYFDEKFNLKTDAKENDSLKESLVQILHEVGGLASYGLRLGRGVSISPSAINSPTKPVKPLILYSYEANQFCRLVREVLTELDIVYELRSAGKNSPRREELAAITGGSTQCPYLIDPNTNVSMAESYDIIKYLYQTYGRWIPPNELLQWISQQVLPLFQPVFALLTPLQAKSLSSKDLEYDAMIDKTIEEIRTDIVENPVVVYTYSLSPFSTETKILLDQLNITYKEISLGAEWIPGLIDATNGSIRRASLLKMTGQSSLPHIFIGGESIGGLFTGTPGLIPALEQNILFSKIQQAAAATTNTATM